MKFESEKIPSHKSQKELFDFLSDLRNYENLMPENTEFSLHESGEGFAFQLKGMPKVGLKLREKQEPDFILFESPTNNLNYQMKVNIESTGGNSQAYIDFIGEFNPMIEMIAKKPLTNFLEQLTAEMKENI